MKAPLLLAVFAFLPVKGLPRRSICLHFLGPSIPPPLPHPPCPPKQIHWLSVCLPFPTWAPMIVSASEMVPSFSKIVPPSSEIVSPSSKIVSMSSNIVPPSSKIVPRSSEVVPPSSEIVPFSFKIGVEHPSDIVPPSDTTPSVEVMFCQNS